MAAEALDLAALRRVHVANVGGAGMSALATVLAEMGVEVSGHDPAASTPFLGPLRDLGVAISTGDARPPLGAVDAVLVSTATPAQDPDVLAAAAAGVPVLHRRVALSAVCATRRTVAVAGTHGKTTTSALLATVLAGAGAAPGWLVGAHIVGLGRSAAWSEGEGPLVVEADESDGTFLELGAQAAIVTNLEADHLEHWGTEAALAAGFERFVAAIPGPTVLCAEDPGAARLAAFAADPVTYGGAGADYVVSELRGWAGGVRFSLRHGADSVRVELPGAPGRHSALNAASALAMAHRLGTPLERGAQALGAFRGVARRFERRGEAGGVTFIDSYDHLPTEVSAALAAARAGSWRRVVCAFQPHRFSRTASLGRAFADAFEGADLLCVTDVYPAGEAPRPGVSGKLVVQAVLDAHPRSRVVYLPSLDEVVGYLAAELRPGDLCLTLGAGDLTTVPDRLLARLGGAPGAPPARRGR